jgi:hypothetical protein
VPALELVELRLLLLKLGRGELLDLELMIDLREELSTLRDQLGVLAVPRGVPGLDETTGVLVLERPAADGEALTAELGHQGAESLERRPEALRVGEGHDRLLEMQRPRAAHLAPHGDPRPRGGIGGQLVGEQDPVHRNSRYSVTRVTQE